MSQPPITKPAVTEQPTADQARRNKRLALIHVGIALAVMAIFVLNTVYK